MTSKVFFPLEIDDDMYPPVTEEYLWCTRADEGLLVIDNIPFFARDVSLGDRISVRDVSGKLQFNAVEVPSVNTTVRVLAHDPLEIPKLREKLEEIGSSVEVNGYLGILAVSIPAGRVAEETLYVLDDEREAGRIGFEESSVR